MKRVTTTVLTALALLAPAGIADAGTRDPGVAVTEAGPVRGTVTSGSTTYQGIPYAAPPVGPLRWQPPRPAARWTGLRDATRPAPRCAQPQNIGPASDSEDCLYLNVTAPKTPGRKPVMVWLHGGGNVYGAGSDYDARRLAEAGDVVVVTVNYRLGVFGFLGLPRLDGAGTFGLQDQQAALRWVRRNAVAFGGNPGSVTLFGQSAGSYDVCAQLTSPAARGLFQRAIMESGSCSMTWPRNGVNPGIPAGSPWQSQESADAQGVALAASLGCAGPSQVDCLRALPVDRLLAATQSAALPAVAYGNRVLPWRPDRALAEGRFARIPVLSGSNLDEQRLATAFLPQAFTEDGYRQLLADAFGADAPAVAAKYPAGAYESSAVAWATVATDRVWSCAQDTDRRVLARYAPVYGYEFADRAAPPQFPFPAGLPSGAYHGAEMVYLFDLNGTPAPLDAGQRALADRMIRSWTTFARTGNPGPEWPRTAAQSLAPGKPATVDVAAEHNCSFWVTIGNGPVAHGD
ncbi:carboxylesterase family protein [Amycolatopsis sp. OK19-0408]|uniref:Carboxylic ester hydrolase n=1 Tax=Amycolatopsis iheyensis TaxID=2945988 RepID=A0A9X2SQU6_9PSEU|nr:carboxylesterase family protein [Amycolatopsis iheyensis]MCR6489085.1 carboxylesterase family protein [Amycolatopsis iheyensis]